MAYFDEEDKNPQIEETDASDSFNSLSILPKDGIVKPYSETIITMFFKPEIKEEKYGFEKQFILNVKELRLIVRKVFIDCHEIDQRILLNLQGSGITPLVTVSPSVMRFGDCPVHDRRDVKAVLSNKSDAIVTYSFPQTAHFKMTPSKGSLQPLKSQSVILSFQPSQIGKFKTIIQLLILNGLSFVDIKLVGEAKYNELKKTITEGTDKIGTDFDKKFKFINPSNILRDQLEKLKMNGLIDKETVSLTSSDRDHVYSSNR